VPGGGDALTGDAARVLGGLGGGERGGGAAENVAMFALPFVSDGELGGVLGRVVDRGLRLGRDPVLGGQVALVDIEVLGR
jgi:hypothetical protein